MSENRTINQEQFISVEEEVQKLRKQLVLGILRATAVFGLFAVVAATIDYYTSQQLWAIPVYWGVYVIFVFFIFWKRASYTIQARLIEGLFYIAGTANFLSDGLSGSARAFMLIFPFTASILLGRKEGIFALTLGTLTMVGIGGAFCTGLLTASEGLGDTSLIQWIGGGLVVFTLGLMMVLSLDYITSRLLVALDQQRRLALELEAERAGLEQRVAERTAQLEAANKELDAFAYSVSHDLRAPLRHIDGFMELLREKTATKLDEQSQHCMTNISDAANRMGNLIDNLLSFSRMGRQQMSKAQVDIGRLAREVIEELEPEAEGRHINWHIADMPKVRGDQAMLKMVLTNLISNALKFTSPRQQAEIEIGCIPEKQNEIVIFIRDNGVGFDMDYADKLFGVFQRLHRADEFEGTGIGLANVRRVISRHGGRVWAEGRVDDGATFYFSLPKSVQGM